MHATESAGPMALPGPHLRSGAAGLPVPGHDCEGEGGGVAFSPSGGRFGGPSSTIDTGEEGLDAVRGGQCAGTR